MKKLRIFFLAFFVLSCTTVSFAQTFGIRAGLNLSNMLDKYNDVTYSSDYDFRPGFHLGGTVEFPLGKIFSFESGLILMTRGYNYHDSGTESGYEWEDIEKIGLFYLDIPLNAKVNFEAGKIKIYGTLGPYVGIGLSGKGKYEYTYDGETDSGTETINWGSGEDDHLKRMDFGLTVGAGVEINSFTVGAFYSHGLANIAATTDGGVKVSNRVVGLSVGYKFLKK